MPSLRGTVTEQNLKNAFAWESQANPRYLYLAQKADAEGFNDVAAVFRSTSESKTGNAHRHLEYLEEVRDPGKPIGPARDNLKVAIRRRDPRIPGTARAARQEGFDETTGSRRSAKAGSRMPTASSNAPDGFDLMAPQFEENWTTIGGKHGCTN